LSAARSSNTEELMTVKITKIGKIDAIQSDARRILD
jgi:hypothetical protein